jgi:two-component system nitrogen regulation sensor histidine kinase NtrY
MLVDEYNKMVKKLEVERPGIGTKRKGRGLARNGAAGGTRDQEPAYTDEIKHPVPAECDKKDAPNVKELSENMAVTLIEQIDQLSKIAGDFSQFANIGNARMETFDITEVLSSIVRLYSANPRIQIEWYKEEGSYLIYSDRVQMNRLFTNLLQNAIEANTDAEK